MENILEENMRSIVKYKCSVVKIEKYDSELVFEQQHSVTKLISQFENIYIRWAFQMNQ